MRHDRPHARNAGPKYSPMDPRSLKVPEAPAVFASNDKLMERASLMFACRRRLVVGPVDSPGVSSKLLRKMDTAWTNYWHRSAAMTRSDRVSLACLMNRHRLSRIEREVLIALIMSRLGLLEEDLDSCKDLLSFLQFPRTRFLDAVRALSEHGRLFKRGLITHDDPDEDLCEREIIVSPRLVSEALLGGSDKPETGRQESEEDVAKRVIALQSALQTRSFILHRFQVQERRHLMRTNNNITRTYNNLEHDLTRNPSWKLSPLFGKELGLEQTQRLMLLYLIGSEMNVVTCDESAPTGSELARLSAESAEDASLNLAYLKPRAALIRGELIQPCGGSDPLMDSDDRTLAGTEYELTEKAQRLFGLHSKIKETTGRFSVRPARVALSQLVLSAGVQQSIAMVLAQARNTGKMLQDWGLGEAIAYGRGVTILFAGPPGTGKTACAEGIAHALEKPILVADYADILNCYIGNTQKNIARIFREARARKAVLFWDEADAMFYNRELARHTWEIQDANVILTELEKFEGVCILASNRKLALDPALERRISLKVAFELPGQPMRRQIWKRHLPPKLPLADGVDLDELAKPNLSGGEIKNAVLNAARMALARGAGGPLTREDFSEAIRLEIDGRFRNRETRAIGFCAR